MNWPAEGDSRVPYWVYTDEGVYRREIERIFEGPTWSYLALECELPKAGDWKRSTIGEKSVLVVRGEDGVVRGFLNRCAHRGVQLCQDVTGHVRQDDVGVVALPAVPVAAAHPCRPDANDDAVRRGRRVGNVDDVQRPAELVVPKSSHHHADGA